MVEPEVPARNAAGEAVSDPKPPSRSPLEAARKRLASFSAEGGAQFDPVGVSHVSRLLERAAGMPEIARERLVRRARAYLEGLEQAFQRSRQHAVQDVERLERVYSTGRFLARAAYQSGDLARVRRIARRHPQGSARLRDQVTRRWEEALDAEIEKRGLSSPGTVDAPTPEQVAAPDLPPASGLDMAVALYRHTAAQADARRAITRAVATLPTEAGRYHAATVATRALRALQAAQPYLHALMSQLETITLLEQLAPPTPPSMEPERAPRKERAPGKERPKGPTKGRTRRRTAGAT